MSSEPEYTSTMDPERAALYLSHGLKLYHYVQGFANGKRACLFIFAGKDAMKVKRMAERGTLEVLPSLTQCRAELAQKLGVQE